MIAPLTAANTPSKPQAVLRGAVGGLFVPLNFFGGALIGAYKSARHGVQLGHRSVPVVGAAVGLAIGVAVGPVRGALRGTRHNLREIRRVTGRYAEVNPKLNVAADTIEGLKLALSSIPWDRLSQERWTGHVLVRIDADERRLFENEGGLAPGDGGIDVNVNKLMRRLDGTFGETLERNVFVKGRALSGASESTQDGRLCRLERHRSGDKIYIEKNPSPEDRGRVGLQFLYALHLMVNVSPDNASTAR